MSSPIKLEIEGKKYVAYPEQSEGEKKRSLRPEYGTIHFVILSDEDHPTEYIWKNYEFQERRFKNGNAFLSLSEAIRELAYRQALQRVNEWIYEHDAGEKWEGERDKFSLLWNALEEEFRIQGWTNWKFFSPFGYLKSEEACAQLIRKMDSDLRIIFNV